MGAGGGWRGGCGGGDDRGCGGSRGGVERVVAVAGV